MKGYSEMEYLYVVLALFAAAGVFALLKMSTADKPTKQVTRLDL
jgi:hypothetical protein